MAKLFGGIEAGGTKFVCAVGTGPDDLVITEIPTTSPDETLQLVVAFFSDQPSAPEAIGIGSFGPIDTDKQSPTYGFITTSPKPGWHNIDIVRTLNAALHVPIVFDTDVNMAARGEHIFGAARGHESFVYLTVGTGIGGGAMVDGKMLEGLSHPEMGHMFIPQHLQKDQFSGVCPYHKNCLEGLASGTAIRERWNVSGEELLAGHEGWQLEAHYLACGVANLVLVLSPELIIMGGSVMKHQGLIEAIRSNVVAMLNGYINLLPITADIDNYIVRPGQEGYSAVLGAIASCTDDV